MNGLTVGSLIVWIRDFLMPEIKETSLPMSAKELVFHEQFYSVITSVAKYLIEFNTDLRQKMYYTC